jgi:hypothetical protein
LSLGILHHFFWPAFLAFASRPAGHHSAFILR